ncbi:hypothetical protein ACFL4V_00125 [Candidatus Latescibacterota bacterium]
MMIKVIKISFRCLFVLLILQTMSNQIIAKSEENRNATIVQAHVVLTVSESKRLIARAVAQMPIIKRVLNEGMIIITKGTTNTYVAEEITRQKIEKGAFVSGRIYPAKGEKRLNPSIKLPDIVLIDGKIIKGLSLTDAVKELKQGDVVIKGANALDYANKTAGVFINSSPTASGGTTGIFIPYVVARKAHIVIPIGLEKNVAGNVVDLTKKMNEPLESLNRTPSMFLLTGEIVTEIEALKILTGISAFQAGAGGIGGAEGSVSLVLRGQKEQVEKALQLVEEIQGELPFVE